MFIGGSSWQPCEVGRGDTGISSLLLMMNTSPRSPAFHFKEVAPGLGFLSLKSRGFYHIRQSSHTFASGDLATLLLFVWASFFFWRGGN